MTKNKHELSCTFYVIAFGQSALVEKCLQHISKVISTENIILVDNASPVSLAPIAKNFKIRCIQAETNVGYAGGCNIAVKDFITFKTPWMCVLNSDVFIQPEFFTGLDKFLEDIKEDKSIAAFQPALYFDQEYRRTENVGISYYKSGLAFQAKQLRQPCIVNGACIFLRRSAITYLLKTDGFVFEEIFWSYAEDVELSLRLQSRGWKTIVVPMLKATHLQSASFGKRSARSLWFYARNLLWTLLLTRSTREMIFSLPFIVLGQLRIFSEFIVRGRPDFYVSLLWETFLKRSELKNKRREWRGKQMIDLGMTYQFGAFPLWR